MPRKPKRIITLTTETQAVKGSRFVVHVSSKCRTCRLYRICMGKLREGASYEIIGIRKIKHTCPILGSAMKVVEVIELPIKAALPTKKAYEGTIITFTPIPCPKNWRCRNATICKPKALAEGEKTIIEKVKEKIHCPGNLDLRLVLLRRLDSLEQA